MSATELQKPKFLYFDIGNVLLYFDHRRAARQLADVYQSSAERIWGVVFAGQGLNYQIDAGALTTDEAYEALCTAMGRRPDFNAVWLAASDIFRLNISLKTVVSRLAAAGNRLGLLSNTSDMHWRFFADGRYGLIPEAFEQHALSYRLRLMKPGREIYQAAADLARVSPGEVFYVDDIPANVEGARAAGFDAVLFTTTADYVAELRRRGVEFSY